MTIITYDGWKKVNDSYPESEMKEHNPKMIILHHSEIPDSKSKGIKTIQNIKKYHVETRKFTDIAYHYLIDSDGIIYEGRKEKHVGAHCFPNNGKLGICLIMNGDKEKLSKKMKDTLVELLIELCAKYAINPIKWIRPHSEYSSKTCPGKNVKNELDNIRKEVKKGLKL